MRDAVLFTQPELIRLLSSDCRVLLTILGRHRHRLSPVEIAVVAALARDHGLEQHQVEPRTDNLAASAIQPEPMTAAHRRLLAALETEL